MLIQSILGVFILHQLQTMNKFSSFAIGLTVKIYFY